MSVFKIGLSGRWSQRILITNNPGDTRNRWVKGGV